MNKITSKITIGFMFCAALAFSTFADILNVPQEYQEKDQWCWNASALAILSYYGFNPSQTEIADWAVEGYNIPNYIDNEIHYNYDHYIGKYVTRKGSGMVLSHFGNIASSWVDGFLSQDEVSNEINTYARPMMIGWSWNTGGGHAVDIVGIDGDIVYIMDPWPTTGPTINTYDWTVQGGGHTWSQTLRLGYLVNFTTDGTVGAILTGDLSQYIAENSDASPVAAISPANYRFVNWTQDGVVFSSDNPLTVKNVVSDMSLVANFAKGVTPVASTQRFNFSSKYSQTLLRSGVITDTHRYSFSAKLDVPEGGFDFDRTTRMALVIGAFEFNGILGEANEKTRNWGKVIANGAGTVTWMQKDDSGKTKLLVTITWQKSSRTILLTVVGTPPVNDDTDILVAADFPNMPSPSGSCRNSGTVPAWMVLGSTVWTDSLPWQGKYDIRLMEKNGTDVNLNSWSANSGL